MEKRKRRSSAEWSSLVGQWGASGQSAQGFAARHGLSVATLYWWRTRLRGETSHGRSGVTSVDTARGGLPSALGFTQVRVAEREVSEGRLEVVARSGHVVRVHGEVSAAALRAVLSAVERC